MSLHDSVAGNRAVLAAIVAALIALPPLAQADEREDLEKLRATVLMLVETLVSSGVLPRDQADAMMRDAQSRATARLAALPPPATTADGKKVVRVPYVPEAVKTQMRDEIKAQVLAEAKEFQQQPLLAASSPGIPIRIEGDVRVRIDQTRLDPSNTAAGTVKQAADAAGLTRAPDIAGNTGNNLASFNTQEDAIRTRMRVRLAAVADISDAVQATVGIASGGTTGPTSTNITLGQSGDRGPGYLNRYNVSLDRASLRFIAPYGVNVIAGRFNNPFVKTDLVWSEDLNMDGVAASYALPLDPSLKAFGTAGWFPLSVGNPNVSRTRYFVGLQGGVDWQLGTRENRLKLAAALYNYHGEEGIAESVETFNNPGIPDYGVRSEHGPAYRQRGNTLFRLNYPSDGLTTTYWGLASGFNELDLNAQLDVVQFEPLHVVLNANYVKNLAFNRAEMSRRAGVAISDGSDTGYQLRAQVGTRTVSRFGDWNASIAYRYLGSDAVLDAFTNSDFGLGGTNTKGFVLGGSYGLAKNTALQVKLMSAKLIHSLVPPTGTRLTSDVLHVDLISRF